MRFAVTILGNNSAIPSHERFPTAQVVTYEEELFLIDCGEGTQMQLAKYKIRRNKIHHIFISHLHGDHYFGLIGLINSFNLLQRTEPLHLYAPAELASIIWRQLECAATTLHFPLHFHPLQAPAFQLIADFPHLRVSCFPTRHRILCFGFLFEEKPRHRKVIAEKAREAGVPLSFYKNLQRGEDYVSPSGKVIPNDSLTLPPPRPRKYAYCADTLYDEGLIPYIAGCDVIYHETTYLQHDLHRAIERFHSTTLQAATLARKALQDKGRLLIGHFSSRYERLDDFETECRSIFPETYLALQGATYFIGTPWKARI
ncbi:MAG: ribonuclease Z [Thermoflavifilum sp.]|jgi:ribonuclease Z|uniref:ribonuclease Z n=1 Tax=Thermoflavifilum sp. TaxID=1968839 RepID=UPI0018A3D9BB|nr:ribonuclease Z [Thermoflavifilum sp.]QOR76112.1 MAG: ribonuclease Z [Thermoflavifilum sp.]